MEINYKKISKKYDNIHSTNPEIKDEYVMMPKKILKEIINDKPEKIPKNGDFLDITLKNLLYSLAKNYRDIINELIILFSKKDIIKDDEHFSEVHNFKFILTGIIEIFTKENRLIYSGFLLLIISFSLYFIEISSK